MTTKSIAWNDGSGDYITLTYTGLGNDSITISSPVNNGSARSKSVTVSTQSGDIQKTITISQTACPVPIGTILNYQYTGTVQDVTLPAGKYKLQVWGAQGGPNVAMQEYGVYVATGGKGGYSEGVLTISQSTKLYIFVGGQGSSSGNGGWNGGGGFSRKGTQSKTNNNQFGYGEAPIVDNYRFCPACSGAGWYGGGRGVPSNSNIDNVESMGGGSGFVNIAANASYRPSGYTGLQLDSGETIKGDQSFTSPSGTTETGHSGNGYARITRLS